MKTLLLISGFLAANTCVAGDVTSIEDAWDYLTQRQDYSQWVVIASNKPDGFVQCQNYGGYLACPFPMWAKAPPGTLVTTSGNPQSTPFPEITGTETRRYAAFEKAETLKRVLAGFDLQADDVYSQVFDDSDKLIGSSYEIRIALEFDFTEFEPLVEEIFREVWMIVESDSYMFETDR